MVKFKDYYKILGVDRHAERDEIRKVFHRVAFELHPDRNGSDPEAPAKLRLAIEAWEVLGDHRRRAKYDLERFGRAAKAASPAASAKGRARPAPPQDNAAWRQRTNWSGPDNGNGNGKSNGGSRPAASPGGHAPRAKAEPKPAAPGPQLGRRFVGIRKARAELGKDDRYEVRLSGHEAASGLILKLEVPAGAFRPKTLPCSVCKGKGSLFRPHKRVKVHVPCSFCQGRGYFTIKPKKEDEELVPLTVSIPAGVHDGAKLTVPGTVHGDLNLILRIDRADNAVGRPLDLDSLLSN